MDADKVRRELFCRQFGRVVLEYRVINKGFFVSTEYWWRLDVVETRFRSTVDLQDKAAVFRVLCSVPMGFGAQSRALRKAPLVLATMEREERRIFRLNIY